MKFTSNDGVTAKQNYSNIRIREKRARPRYVQAYIPAGTGVGFAVDTYYLYTWIDKQRFTLERTYSGGFKSVPWAVIVNGMDRLSRWNFTQWEHGV